ncbi:MAG: hypothetical protein JSW11_00835 [Candidatus Heimdallarchaeota archaeon]|nr:MAG: hypothetical protein JSW11_00835 [Candidatus Heimdallarchaeota archaeon]
MNQKQRDLLTTMIKAKTEKIVQQLNITYPSYQKDTSYYGGQKGIEIIVCQNPDIVENIKPVDRKRYNQLKFRNKKLLEELDAIKTIRSKAVTKAQEEYEEKSAQIEKVRQENDGEWNQLFDSVVEFCNQKEISKQSAIQKLNEAMEDAILQIQFAESAEEAKSILESLPTVEELMSC